MTTPKPPNNYLISPTATQPNGPRSAPYSPIEKRLQEIATSLRNIHEFGAGTTGMTDTYTPTFQDLIESGTAWVNRGGLGKQALNAIRRGDAVLGNVPHHDYRGHRVPSRHEIYPGALGTVEYAEGRLDAREAAGEDVSVHRQRIDEIRRRDRA